MFPLSEGELSEQLKISWFVNIIRAREIVVWRFVNPNKLIL